MSSLLGCDVFELRLTSFAFWNHRRAIGRTAMVLEWMEGGYRFRCPFLLLCFETLLLSLAMLPLNGIRLVLILSVRGWCWVFRYLHCGRISNKPFGMPLDTSSEKPSRFRPWLGGVVLWLKPMHSMPPSPPPLYRYLAVPNHANAVSSPTTPHIHLRRIRPIAPTTYHPYSSASPPLPANATSHAPLTYRHHIKSPLPQATPHPTAALPPSRPETPLFQHSRPTARTAPKTRRIRRPGTIRYRCRGGHEWDFVPYG